MVTIVLVGSFFATFRVGPSVGSASTVVVPLWQYGLALISLLIIILGWFFPWFLAPLFTATKVPNVYRGGLIEHGKFRPVTSEEWADANKTVHRLWTVVDWIYWLAAMVNVTILGSSLVFGEKFGWVALILFAFFPYNSRPGVLLANRRHGHYVNGRWHCGYVSITLLIVSLVGMPRSYFDNR